MYFSLMNNNLVFHDSGRKDPNVFKVIGLSASIDPPNWSRALQAAQKAKDLGILMGVMTRGEDAVSEENFRNLSSGHVTWFGNEKQHLKNMHRLMDSGNLCRMLPSRDQVRKAFSERSISILSAGAEKCIFLELACGFWCETRPNHFSC